MTLFRFYRLLKNSDTATLFDKNFYKNINNCLKFSGVSSEHLEEIVNLSDGKSLSISSGKFARLADGCSVVKLGDTSVMVTAVSKTQPTNSSFIPLIVDYRQKAAAAGRIPTNFLRREIGTTEHEILTSRLIDRSIRPLFTSNWPFETQVICNMLAVDGIHDPETMSINGASAALSLSDIPWDGPVAAVRLGMIDDNILVNPTRKELQNSMLNLIVTATSNNLVVMLEGSASNILVQDLKKAIKIGVRECQNIIIAIKKLQKSYGKLKRDIPLLNTESENELFEKVKSVSESKIREIFTNYTLDKISRDNAINKVRDIIIQSIREDNPNLDHAKLMAIFSKVCKECLRTLIFENDVRCDGRRLNELRPIECETNLFKPVHGSAMFQRGQTQVLCTVTLDSLESALKMDTTSMLISGMKEKNFFLHYEFPPYATNETGRTGTIGRRELGHGALAERALKPILPKDYPFTIRLTSEVTQSNGSSSMASVCGGSLALMDAGVPITSPTAGVAMGLITKYNESTKTIEDYRILTDILGIEDYFGDMDFKIAASRNGITALQADIKIPGLPLKIVMESITQSIVAKNEIIKIMHKTISEPCKNKENSLPISEKLEVPIHQRAKFLGVGGINLKRILIETGVQIHSLDENTFTIFAPNRTAMNEAKEIIEKNLEKSKEPTLEFGGIYTAKIVEIRESGVMVTLYPNMVPTLLPNSQLDQRKIHHPSVLGVEVGQELQIKYFGRDPASGHMRISRKVLQEPVHAIHNFVSKE